MGCRRGGRLQLHLFLSESSEQIFQRRQINSFIKKMFEALAHPKLFLDVLVKYKEPSNYVLQPNYKLTRPMENMKDPMQRCTHASTAYFAVIPKVPALSWVSSKNQFRKSPFSIVTEIPHHSAAAFSTYTASNMQICLSLFHPNTNKQTQTHS